MSKNQPSQQAPTDTVTTATPSPGLMDETSVDISVVIPCYSSSEGLEELTSRLVSTLESMNRRFEVILVNDASPDNGLTWFTISELTETTPHLRGINLQFNVGQFLATLSGLEESKGQLVAIMDDDLQHAPEDLPTLISMLENEPLDAVLANLKSKRHGLFRNFGSKVVGSTFAILHGKPKGLKMSSFAVFKRPVVESMIAHQTRRPVLNALVLASTKRIGNKTVEHHSRMHGKSGYTLRRLVRATLDNVFYATTAPLRAFSYLGALISLTSFCYSGFLLYRWSAYGSTVQGFTTLAILISIFGGLTLLGLGLMGEYIDRIISETSGRPRWIIADRCNNQGAE